MSDLYAVTPVAESYYVLADSSDKAEKALVEWLDQRMFDLEFSYRVYKTLNQEHRLKCRAINFEPDAA